MVDGMSTVRVRAAGLIPQFLNVCWRKCSGETDSVMYACACVCVFVSMHVFVHSCAILRLSAPNPLSKIPVLLEINEANV